MALKYLRDNLKSFSWVLWATIFVLFILVFFEWGGYNEQQQGNDPVAATVGNEVISMSEFQNTYQNLERTYQQLYGDRFDRDLIRQFLPKQALDQLINRKILLMEADKIGLKAVDSEIQSAILEVPYFQDEDGRFVGTEEYLQRLRSIRMTADEFEASIREDVILNKLDNVLAQTLHVSDADVEEAYRENAEKAKIRFVQQLTSEFTDIRADDAEVQAYFAEHSVDYALPEQRVANYILVDTVSLRQQLNEDVSDEELQAYYNDHAEEFTNEEQVRARHILLKTTPDRDEESTRAELEAIRQRIEGGENFAALAGDLSEDEGSATRGGDLGYFGRNQMVKPFEDAAFGAATGDLVGPIQSDFGFHLIQVEDRREGGLQPFDEVRARVLARVVGEQVVVRAEAKGQEVARHIESEGLTSEEALQAYAESEGLTWTTTDPFAENDNITGIGRAPDFNAAIFGLKLQETTQAIQVPRGWAVGQLKEILPPRTPELAEVRDRVQIAADQEKRKTAAKESLETMKASLESGEDFAALAETAGLQVQESTEFGRFGSVAGLGTNRALIDHALASDVGAWGGPVETAQGAVLYQVTERKTFDATEFGEQKDALRDQQEQQQLQQIKQSMIEVRRRDLTPRYGRQVLETFEIQTDEAAG